HHVLGLEVAVEPAAAVRELERATDLAEDLEVAEQRVALGPRGIGGVVEELAPAATGHALHDDHGLPALVAPERVHRDDVRVLEAPDDARLAHHQRAPGGPRVLRALDGDLA